MTRSLTSFVSVVSATPTTCCPCCPDRAILCAHAGRRVLDLETDGKVGVHLDGLSGVGVSRLEVLEGPSGRLRRSPAERARIAAESMMPGVTVADVG